MPQDIPASLIVVKVVLITMMVTFGSINTIATKWVDRLTDKEGTAFHHPFVQAVVMFIGQSLCLVAFFFIKLYEKYCNRNRNVHVEGDTEGLIDAERTNEPARPRFNPLIFLPPAICDMVATSIMYFGLTMTHASTYQMLRGAKIVFTGILSMMVLRTVLHGYKWLGMGFVTIGLIVVGLAEIVFGTGSKSDVHNVIIGDVLIVLAQVIVANQMVYEEKFVKKYDVPALLAVGLEGFFGMTVLTLLIIPMYFIHVSSTFSHNPFNRLEDPFYAFRQMGENPMIIFALCGTILSMALFNFAAISVTKVFSATTRMVLDSARTLVIWTVCLGLGWQNFVGLQLLGFALLLLGLFVYNDIIIGPWIRAKIMPALESRGYSTACCFSFYGLERDSPLID